MRRIIGHVLRGCTAVALVAGGALAAAAPAAASTGVHNFPLAGNGNYLVYSQNTAPNGSRGATGCAHGSPTLHVRTKAGTTRTLATPHQHRGTEYADNANPCDGLELNGHFLALEGIGGTRDTMYWWDLKKHTHGQVRLPGGTVRVTQVGAVAGGWLFARTGRSDQNAYTATALYRQGTGGRVTTYARLARFSVFDVETSPQGVLVGNTGGPLRYLPVGASTPRTLARPAHRYSGQGCFALTSTFAACQATHENNADQLDGYEASITSLTGKHTVASPAGFTPTGSYLLAPSATSRGIVGLVRPTRTQVSVRGLGTDGNVTSAHGHGATTLVVAYDKIIVGHSGGKITMQGSVTGKQHTLIGTH